MLWQNRAIWQNVRSVTMRISIITTPYDYPASNLSEQIPYHISNSPFDLPECIKQPDPKENMAGGTVYSLFSGL